MREKLYSEFADFASGLADEARATILNANLADADFQCKVDGKDPVTDLDRNIEAELRGRIRESFPDHGIVGEEIGETEPDAEFVWMIDPIDGTDDLIRGVPLFGSIISILESRKPVVAVIDLPLLDVRLNAVKGAGAHCNGQRLGIPTKECLPRAIVVPSPEDINYWGGGEKIREVLEKTCANQRVYRNVYGHSLVIRAKIAAGVEIGVHWWDIAATMLLVAEAGGSIQVRSHHARHWFEQRHDAVFGSESVVMQIADEIFN